MTIYHFSDIHEAAVPDSGKAFLGKRLIGACNYYFRRRKQVNRHFLDKASEKILATPPNAIIISGDFTSIGSAREFRAAQKSLQTLRDSKIPIYLVPGNHDYYAHCKKSQQALKDFIHWLSHGRQEWSQFPQKFTLSQGDQKLELLLLDQSRPNSLKKSSGQFCQKQNDFLEAHLHNSENACLIVGHYPTRDAQGQPLASYRALDNAEQLRAFLKHKNVKAYLCGHIHYPFLRKDEEICTEICAGSLTMSGMLSSLSFESVDMNFQQQWINLR